jgi:hypothetical protein
MARGLKMGLSYDTLSDDYRRRVTVALMAIADGVKARLASINSPAVKARADVHWGGKDAGNKSLVKC